MKKHLLFSLVAFCLSVTTQARSLVLQLSDGTKIYYLLGGEQNPVMKIVDGEVVVNTDQFAFSGIEKFYISETDDPNPTPEPEPEPEPDAVAGVAAGGMMQQGVLYVQAGNVKVYTLDGQQLAVPTSVRAGMTAIDMNSLPQGVYVLSIQGKSVKYMKR